LKGKQYVAGDYLTFADFQAVETLALINFISDGKLYETYPDLQCYFQRLCEMPEMADYLNSDRFLKKPFNNKVAKINN